MLLEEIIQSQPSDLLHQREKQTVVPEVVLELVGQHPATHSLTPSLSLLLPLSPLPLPPAAPLLQLFSSSCLFKWKDPLVSQ